MIRSVESRVFRNGKINPAPVLLLWLFYWIVGGIAIVAVRLMFPAEGVSFAAQVLSGVLICGFGATVVVLARLIRLINLRDNHAD